MQPGLSHGSEFNAIDIGLFVVKKGDHSVGDRSGCERDGRMDDEGKQAAKSKRRMQAGSFAASAPAFPKIVLVVVALHFLATGGPRTTTTRTSG
jgi:hypothetical protein